MSSTNPAPKKVLEKVGSLNTSIASKLAMVLSSVWCFWAILILVVVPLLSKTPATLTEWVLYLSSAVFQAVALPILAFVNNIENEKTRALLNEIRDDEFQVLRDLAEERASREAFGPQDVVAF